MKRSPFVNVTKGDLLYPKSAQKVKERFAGVGSCQWDWSRVRIKGKIQSGGHPYVYRRKKQKVVFLAHCLLNQNAISDGTAVHPAAFKEIIQVFLDAEVGLVQLPCPELCCLGLDRGDPLGAQRPVVVENTRIRGEMQRQEPHDRLMLLADYTMLQITEYHKHGFEILGIVGANRSPNCGVDTTSMNDEEVAGKGEFMAELTRRLEAMGLHIPMVGIKGSDDLVKKMRALL